MKPRSSAVAAVLVVAVAVVAMACTTPAPITGPSPSPPPAVSSAPASTPAGYAEFTSASPRYGVCYPESWVPLERVPLDDGHDGDMFVGPPGETVNMVVTIVSEPAGGLGSAAYAEAAIQNLRGRGIGVLRAGPAAVDGAPAGVVTFPRLTARGQRYTVQETIWVSADRGWVHIVVFDIQKESEAAAIAAQMLGCFRTV